jgi:hypothetical protein
MKQSGQADRAIPVRIRQKKIKIDSVSSSNYEKSLKEDT